MARKPNLSRNLNAFLDMLGWSELGDQLLKQSDDGYNVIVGSLPGKMNLFTDYSKHPNVAVTLPRYKVTSTAAGKYQILYKYAVHYMRELRLPDFGPVSQDTIAIQLIRECKALGDIDAGHIASAITKCKSRWASLPSAGYGQREHDLDDLIAHFITYGGVLARA